MNRSDEEPQMNSGNDRALTKWCRELNTRYSNNMHSCRHSLAALIASVLSKGNDDINKDDAKKVFQTLLSLFQMKCTIILDMIQANPDFVTVYVDCWCLVFRMTEKKMHGCLTRQDGLVFKIFGNAANLATQSLLQIVVHTLKNFGRNMGSHQL